MTVPVHSRAGFDRFTNFLREPLGGRNSMTNPVPG